MQSQERRVLTIDAVNSLATSPYGDGIAILTDADCEENYVQLRSLPNGLAMCEVTSRRWGGRLAPLTEQEIAALMRLGFARPDPNLRQVLNLSQAEAIADICEQAFAILDSPATFTLGREMLLLPSAG